MISTYRLLALIFFGLNGFNTFAAQFAEGVVNETRHFFPADKSAPIEFTFLLNTDEKYIMYTREVIVFMPEQIVRVKKSNVLGKESRSIACLITYDNLVVATTGGDKHFIKLETPTVHKATKGRGC
jgi:hypothetical protein